MQNVVSMLVVNIERGFCVIQVSNSFFDQRLRLTRENGFIYHHGAGKDYEVTWDSLLLLVLVAREHQHISRIQLVRSLLDPFVLSVDPDLLWLDSHSSQPFEVLKPLHHNCTFKDKEHSEGHQSEVPVLVK